MKKQNGITLISLIITIIIMLILAGVSLSMVMGEGSLVEQATAATDNTRGGEVKESVDLAIAVNKAKAYSTVGTYKTKDALVQELYSNNKITLDEKNKLLGENGETEVDNITIGDISIDFSGIDSSVSGATIISFTININTPENAVTCQAEEGMTWAQWVASSYNTLSATIEPNAANGWNYIYVQGNYLTDLSNGVAVDSANVITADNTYAS